MNPSETSPNLTYAYKKYIDQQVTAIYLTTGG